MPNTVLKHELSNEYKAVDCRRTNKNDVHTGTIAQEGLTADEFIIEGKERISHRKTDIRVNFVFPRLSIKILKVK